MALNFNSPFLLNIFLAVIAAVILGAIVGIPSLRIKDDYFVIATFAFQIITFSILNNLVDFTGGPLGLPGIPQPVIFGIEISSHISYLILSGILAVIAYWFCKRVVQSPIGRILKALREDEVLTQSAGKNVTFYKVQIFMISAGVASVAGVLYATYITYIDPTSFTVMESILIISMVIIGGTGSLKGSVIGAVVLVALPELLRFVGMPNSIAANVRQILYGAALVGFMLWRPKGLIGEYEIK